MIERSGAAEQQNATLLAIGDPNMSLDRIQEAASARTSSALRGEDREDHE
jgi:hypothetical protein